MPSMAVSMCACEVAHAYVRGTREAGSSTALRAAIGEAVVSKVYMTIEITGVATGVRGDGREAHRLDDRGVVVEGVKVVVEDGLADDVEGELGEGRLDVDGAALGGRGGELRVEAQRALRKHAVEHLLEVRAVEARPDGAPPHAPVVAACTLRTLCPGVGALPPAAPCRTTSQRADSSESGSTVHAGSGAITAQALPACGGVCGACWNGARSAEARVVWKARYTDKCMWCGRLRSGAQGWGARPWV